MCRCRDTAAVLNNAMRSAGNRVSRDTTYKEMAYQDYMTYYTSQAPSWERRLICNKLTKHTIMSHECLTQCRAQCPVFRALGPEKLMPKLIKE